MIRTKLRHFLRLFWISQNRKSVIFVLAPGLRSALGVPGCATSGISREMQNANHLKFLQAKKVTISKISFAFVDSAQ